MFDERGRDLLAHWLNGTGVLYLKTDGAWGSYMKNNERLRKQLVEKLSKDAIARTADGQVNITFSAVIENGYYTGYEMLHGTNRNRGGFNILGQVSVQGSGTTRTIKYQNMKYTWNDIIDPNPIYYLDTLFSNGLDIFYSPKDYDIQLNWHADSEVCVGNGKIITKP